MQEYKVDLVNRKLSVFVKGSNEKGARAKGQKFIKTKGVYDAMLFSEDVDSVVGGNWFNYKISSPTLMMIDAVVPYNKAYAKLVASVK